MSKLWYLVKNHRHIGPYTHEQLEQLKSEGKVMASDFVLSQEDLNSGEIKYRAMTEIIRFAPPVPGSSARKSSSEPVSTESASSVDAEDDSYEPPLGSFSDEDLLNNEVSRIFTQAIDSVDLVRSGTQAGIHPSARNAAKTQKTQIGVPREKTNHGVSVSPSEASARIKSFASDQDQSLLLKFKRAIATPMGLSFGFLILVGIAIVSFSKHMPHLGSLTKGVASRSSNQRSPAVESGGARQLRTRPANESSPRPSSFSNAPIRIPTSKREIVEAPTNLPAPGLEAVSGPAEPPSREPGEDTEEDVAVAEGGEETPAGIKEVGRKAGRFGPRAGPGARRPATLAGEVDGDVDPVEGEESVGAAEDESAPVDGE